MKPPLLSFFCVAVLLAGCGPRLSDQRDLVIAANEIVPIVVGPFASEQTIQIAGSAPTAPIRVHVYLREHEEAIERKISLGSPPENLLASESDTEQFSLQATVPPNKEVVVRLQTAGAAEVNVHLEITN